MTIDKALGIQLRLDGKTQKEVAEILGCSLDWVKRNLAGIKQTNPDTPIIDEVRRLGRLPEGVTTGTIKNVITQYYPDLTLKENMKALSDKVTDIKRSARKGNKDVLIRPYWLLPDCPHDCITTIMDMAQHAYELLDRLATDYRRLYDLDESYHNSIIYQLSALSAGEGSRLLPQGLLTYGAHLEHIADVLDDRSNTL